MDAKKVVLLVVALIVAAGTAFMARSLFSQSATPQVQAAAMPKQDGPEILVATRALPVGTIIGVDSFKYQPWPSELVENAYFKKGEAEPASLAGTVVRAAVTAGQPLTKGSLVKPGERGFLAAALGAGMRAVTVSVNASSGVAGFVFPGDRVDLMLTQTLNIKGSDDEDELKSSETFVRNIRVLATDQRTVSDDEEGKKDVRVFSTVTLEVTPRIAEKVSAAASMGQISLSLRSLADNSGELERAIAAGDVNMPANGDPKAEQAAIASIAKRPDDKGGSFVTGADVSTFYRRIAAVTAANRARKAASMGRAASGTVSASGAPVSMGPTVSIRRGSNKDPEVISVGSK